MAKFSIPFAFLAILAILHPTTTAMNENETSTEKDETSTWMEGVTSTKGMEGKVIDVCDTPESEWKSQTCYILGDVDPHQHVRERPCVSYRRQGGGAPHLLPECKENPKDMCYWLRNNVSKTIEAGCICEAFLKKYDTEGNKCTTIDVAPFKGRGEVCTCSGLVQIEGGDPAGTGCNVNSIPDDAGGIADECFGVALKSDGLFTSLLILILSVFFY